MEYHKYIKERKSLIAPELLKTWADMNGFYYIKDSDIISNPDDALTWFVMPDGRKSYTRVYLAGYGTIDDCLLTLAYITKNGAEELCIRDLIDFSIPQAKTSKVMLSRIMTRGKAPQPVDKIWCVTRGWVELIYDQEGEWTEEVKTSSGDIIAIKSRYSDFN